MSGTRGGGRHRTPRLAGRYAGEFNLLPGDRRDMAARLERARDAASAAGRDPDSLLVSSAAPVVAAPDRNGYREELSARAAAAGMDLGRFESLLAARNAPTGTYEEVAERLAELASVGVRRFYFQWWAGFDKAAAGDLLGFLRAELG